MFPQYGKLWPTNGWDPFGSLGHPSKFQRVSRFGSVTARHSSSGHQPNFAALNRGRHLHWAGRPSRWASSHILVAFSSFLLFLQLQFHVLCAEVVTCYTATKPGRRGNRMRWNFSGLRWERSDGIRWTCGVQVIDRFTCNEWQRELGRLM